MNGALRRYQVMSWIVGTALLALTYATIQDWVNHKPGLAHVVSPIHGLLYMLYLATVIQVSVKFRPTVGRIAAMVCSGFVPFLAFFVEHNTLGVLKAKVADTAPDVD
jgi:integral membrane protein